jgi:hypothetical protein
MRPGVSWRERLRVHFRDDGSTYAFIASGELVLWIRQDGEKFGRQKIQVANLMQCRCRQLGELIKQRLIGRRFLDAGSAQFGNERCV